MLRHFFVTAIRNLNKYKFYTFINIFGLTVGITACLVIMLFVGFELSYDRHNVNADRVFRIDRELRFGLNHQHSAATHAAMAEALVREFPEVERAARLCADGSHKFKKDTESLVEWRIVWADNDLLNILTIPFVEGNPENALSDPNTMIVSEEFARRSFPDESALNKIMIMDEKTAYKITGVYKDFPEASHIHFRIFLSMAGLESAKQDEWLGGPFINYVLLRKDADPYAFEAKLLLLITKYIKPQAEQNFGKDFVDKIFTDENLMRYSLRPLLDIHLYSQMENELEGNGDITYVYLLSTIALFILVIAGINFMNLTTARSSTRAREVGIRKVMGSTRGALIRQFLAESIILSIISFALAICLTSFVLPFFNTLANKQLMLPWDSIVLLLALIPFALIIGILAGAYPAFVLSSFQPITVLKGKLTKGTKAAYIRMGLVVFQFSISIFLIIATVTVYRQLEHIRNRKLGFDKEQVFLIRDVFDLSDRLPSVKAEIEKNSYIKSGSITSYFPGPNSARQSPLAWVKGSPESINDASTIEKWIVDYDYISTLGMKIVEGRNFSRDFPSDSSAVILNETAIRILDIDGDPIGKEICIKTGVAGSSPDDYETWTIVGVVGDFNFNSFKETIEPLGLFFGQSNGFISFRIEAGKTEEAVAGISEIWKKMMPGQPFNYGFLDQTFDRMFDFEQRLGVLFSIFAGLAIIIACLGLFALTAFIAEQRTKEIGIRKVMGASISSILFLLSSQFGKLILIAFILTVPLTAYGVHWWLQQYAYRVEIGILIYLGAGFLALLLGLFTMGYQSVKAANMNPVSALRSE
ncbi:MAG: ABC transporter permease [Cyclobacteriaceae bacterium]|nr:ABC transporter permease [Cyclobacteriaceae bacterium]